MSGKPKNEGEGSRSAARAYNSDTEAFVKSGRVDEQAAAARQARDGTERGDLDRAEAAGRDRAKGEDPALAKRHGEGQRSDAADSKSEGDDREPELSKGVGP